jgi:hypothetical protein
MKIHQGEDSIRKIIPNIVQRRESLNIYTPFSDPNRFLLNASLFPQEIPTVVESSDSTYLLGRLQKKGGMGLSCFQVVHNGFLPPSFSPPLGAEKMVPFLLDCSKALGVQTISWNHEKKELFQNQNEQPSKAFIMSPIEKRWILELVGAKYEDFTASLSKKARYNLKRSRKKLSEAFKNGIELEVFSEKTSVKSFLQKCESITKESYHSLIGAGVRDDPTWKSIIEVEATFGRFFGLVLKGDNVPICYQFGTVHGSTFNLEATSFLPQFANLGPGGVLQQMTFEKMYQRGLKKMDYGFGDAPYKQRFGAISFEERNAVFYKNNLIRETLRGIKSANSTAKTLLGKTVKNWIKARGRN